MFFELTAVLSLLLGSASAQTQTIADIVVASSDHTVLEAAVVAAPPEILATLNGTSASYTVFAPTDDAFDLVPPEYLEVLLTPEWQNHLVCFLTSHVIPGTVRAADIPTTATEVATLSKYNVTVFRDGEEAFVDDIPVFTADVNATNGVIHILSESPIFPPCVSVPIVQILVSLNFTTLVSLINQAQTEDVLDVYTIFAPTNEAFAKIPPSILDALVEDEDALRSVLLNHVVPGNVYSSGLSGTVNVTTAADRNITVTATGGTVKIGDATVTTADILAANGVIHVVDTVILPSDFVDPRPTNVDIVAGSQDHTILLRAVTSVDGLVEALNALESYTLLAPTDEAFQMFDGAYLFRSPWERHLLCVVNEHVVSGPAILSSAIADGTTATTLNNDSIEFNVDAQGEITVGNNITISGVDILTSDGVVHVIDGVILPDCVTKSIYDLAGETSDLSTLKSYVDLAGLNGTLSSNNMAFTLFAPSNAAFSKLDPQVVASLQSNVTVLRDVLTYHVLEGVRAFENDLEDEGTVETLGGSTLAFALSNGLPAVNGITFNSDGVLASNGVIYIVQDVLNPSQTFAPASSATMAPAMAGSTPAPATTAPVAPTTPTIPVTAPTTPVTAPTTPAPVMSRSPVATPTDAPTESIPATPPAAPSSAAPSVVVAFATAVATIGLFVLD